MKKQLLNWRCIRTKLSIGYFLPIVIVNFINPNNIKWQPSISSTIKSINSPIEPIDNGNNKSKFKLQGAIKQANYFANFDTVYYGSRDFRPPVKVVPYLPIKFSSSNTNVATITSDGKIHVINAGYTLITVYIGAKKINEKSTQLVQSLHILKAPLTITAKNNLKFFGDANPKLKYKCDGFVNNDNESIFKTSVVLKTTATKGSAVGKYVITAYGATSDNYDINFIEGQLTVLKPRYQ